MSADAVRQAAVLVGTWRDEYGDARLVLVRRADRGAHARQLAFPGGHLEPEDSGPWEAALREAHEEVGLDPDRARLLESLPPITTYTTRIRVHPFLARIEPPELWRPDPREVAEVLEPRAAALLDPAARGEMLVRLAEAPDGLRLPYLRVGRHRLWGVTLRILEPLLPRLLRIEE